MPSDYLGLALGDGRESLLHLLTRLPDCLPVTGHIHDGMRSWWITMRVRVAHSNDRLNTEKYLCTLGRC
jgi:hypothetical protein